MSERKIDIIIPIYNAFDDVVSCIESLKKWTDLTKHRLVLVNDCSPDERIAPFLNSLENEHILVIHNRTNKGFSANINIGMSQSKDNDVILLNSDTVVTRNWVEKMLACAYSDMQIATVTPLSNNATLCSVPYFCEENKIPEDYTIDEYASLVESVSMKKYPTIPVAHGFCMLIKREVIRKIGGFDAETFQRGYGEENDFCYRAREIGYRHVMCDDTFILHTGTSSFISEDKKKLIAAHEKILDERYPKEMQSVRVHCRDNPNGIISHNVRFRTELERTRKRKTVMYLLQADFREDAEDHVGGTQLHVKDLALELRKKYNVVVAARNYSFLNVTLYAEKKEYFFQFYIGEKFEFQLYRSEKFAELYGKILDAFHVDQVHIHHTKDLTLELFYEAKKREIPICVTLHDFYCVCPNVKLLNEKNQLCVGKEDSTMCKSCLKNQQNIAETVDYLKEWRQQQEAVLKMADSVIVPSENAKSIISGYYKEIEEKITTIEHGSDGEPQKLVKPDIREKKTFNVAFLGAINVAKGFKFATKMIEKSSNQIRWHLMGYFEREVPELEKKKNFINVGPYQREKLSELIKEYDIDLVCILPIWPETFCYTVSEAVLAGVPVLVTDIGALGERVQKMQCGWSMPVDSTAEELLQFIENLRINTAEYTKKRENIQKIRLKTVEKMCEEYDQLYQKIERKRYRNVKIDNEWLINGHLLMMASGNSVELQQRLDNAERQLNEISNAFTYRCMLKVARILGPFRKHIKFLIKKL